MPHIVEMSVSPTGGVTVQTRGYARGQCVQASRFLEQALGVRTGEHKTDEFYETAPVQQQREAQP
jgi:hypothetical protein